MESNYLLPNRFKTIGWILFVPSLVLGILWQCHIRFEVEAPVFAIWSSADPASPSQFLTIIHKNIYNEIVAVPLLISLMLVAFSKEKTEDEYILKLRHDSLLWAIYINFILLLLSIVFVFKDAFITIMIYNMYTILLLFIARFNIRLFRDRQALENEK